MERGTLNTHHLLFDVPLLRIFASAYPVLHCGESPLFSCNQL